MKEKFRKSVKFTGTGLGLYDSNSKEHRSVTAYKAIDVTGICPKSTQIIIKYAKVTRGIIAQICDLYAKGKDLGMVVHYHINEMTPEQLAGDEVFQRHALMQGVLPTKLAQVIFDNQ